MRIFIENLRRLIKGTDESAKPHRFPELTDAFVKKDIILKIPSFDGKMVKAIKLIAPHFDIRKDEESRRFWEANQNATCWAEYQVFSKYISGKQKQKKCLEIGPGMGRSVVFFNKVFGWEDAEIHLYESTGKQTKYTLNGPRFTDSFCGNTSILKDILGYNDVKNYKIFDAKKLGFRIDNLPGPYDVIYSLYAAGYHWALEHFIDEILSLMHDQSLAFFIINDRFQVFEKLERVHYEIFEYTTARPVNGRMRMLVMSKSELKECS